MFCDSCWFEIWCVRLGSHIVLFFLFFVRVIYFGSFIGIMKWDGMYLH